MGLIFVGDGTKSVGRKPTGWASDRLKSRQAPLTIRPGGECQAFSI